jgi:DNA recombination protein RmuC
MLTEYDLYIGLSLGLALGALWYFVKAHAWKVEKQFLNEKMEHIFASQNRYSDVFKAISSDALKNNHHTFLELATAKLEKFHDNAKNELNQKHQAIDELLKPIKETLQKVDVTHQELKKSLFTSHASLSEQVKGLASIQNQLQSETNNLVKALRTPHVRGRWGEMQLKRVVEISGMVEHCDFIQQPSVSVDERRLRPDMIIKLPNNKQVVVDSKAVLEAYLEAIETQDDAMKIIKMKDHARLVRNHITQLAAKSYWDQFEAAPEFVVLFLPGEPFFSAALEQDPTLIEYGVEQRVILATPTTLIALLRSVAYGWKQEQIAENAKKISEVGTTLYQRIFKFTEHFVDIRKGLEKTIDAYNTSVGSFDNRLVIAARQLKDYGASTEDEVKEVLPIEKRLREVASETEIG